ncbi:beta-glucosidase [Streptomyces sp. NPDC093225]|uniref:glycoside hydrolase family 3 protein n=1 Tax=Streptomyces sp. NPDC093225 TaxID=3366034 RepID=UPI00382D130C
MAEAVSRRTAMRLLGAAGVVTGAAACGAPLPDPGPGTRAAPAEEAGRAARPAAGPAGPGSEARVAALLEKLTLDEKIGLLHGARDPAPLGQAGYVPGVPRLGIPDLRLADGPAGVRVTARATALPAPVLLASAFDPGLAREYGRVIGREGRALGQDVLLSPMVNLIRTPYAGRNFETFSEDPKLTADLVAEVVRGIQDEGLVATVKHYALNNQEQGRTSVDVVASEQTLHETELRGFESAVAAGCGSVMGAYNKVNGTWACENRQLLEEQLRTRWGFTGWVVSDWDATHSTAAVTAGLDMEMPGGTHFGAGLKKAVTDGTVPVTALDRSVRRILTTLDRFGLLDGTPPARPVRDAAAGARTARKVAVAGAVLLRNVRGTLPLAGPAARGLAVIGPTGGVPFVSGGGSAHVVPDRADGPLTALRARAARAVKDAKVTYALGEDLYGRPLPAAALSPAPALDDRRVAAGRTWTYEGVLGLPAADEWTLLVHYTGRRPAVTLDGKEVFPARAGVADHFAGGLLGTAPDGLTVRRSTLRLTKGTHRLTVTAQGGAAGQRFRLRHTSGATRAADLDAAVRTARAAHSVVLFAYEDATEGRDRTTLALPGGQQRLIEAVTAANPRTTVVLNTSSSTTMPWLAATGAVLQMYYPGQEGAAATAAVLFGDEDPGGRLTQTFPTADGVHPVAGDPVRYPGVGGRQEYTEGIHVGHRWYDAQRVAPLFPFGHGLSYTTFRYEDLRLLPGPGGLRVEFTVRNTGKRRGTEVAQVYVGPSPDLHLDQAVRVLAGYHRLTLAPGRARRVAVTVEPRTLSSWDPARHAWVLGTGSRTVYVGRSSRELPLRARAVVREAPDR